MIHIQIHMGPLLVSGGLLGASWGSLGPPGSAASRGFLELFGSWGFLGILGVFLELFGGFLEPLGVSWAYLGLPGVSLGAVGVHWGFWRLAGASWGLFGVSWGFLVFLCWLLLVFWGFFRLPGACWGFLGHPGVSFGISWGFLGFLGAS